MEPPSEDYSAMVEPLLPMVRRIAKHLLNILPRWVSLDELVAEGRIGLLEAAKRYRPDRGAQFSTFAYYRVRGAMIDSLRRHSASDPRARAYAATQAALDDLIERQVADAPPPSEGVTPEVAARSLASLLEEAATALVMGETAARTAPEVPPDPESATMTQEVKDLVDAALTSLPEKERTILLRVYVEGDTIEAAGKTLGLTKSWSSRLHARGLKLLRRRLKELER